MLDAGLAGMAIVPGPAGGEGCSAEGGCASCPFMKVRRQRARLAPLFNPCLLSAVDCSSCAWSTRSGAEESALTLHASGLIGVCIEMVWTPGDH